MKAFILLGILLCPVAVFSAESELPLAQAEEPKLYDHYLGLKRMQESLAGRSLEEQVNCNLKFKGRNGGLVSGSEKSAARVCQEKITAVRAETNS